MATISAVILTKNNQDAVKQLVKSLSWCDEIIVIDDKSTDNTTYLAKKAGAKVYVNPLNYNYAAQRNFGLEKVTKDWVLFIDSDEVVTEALRKEIIETIKSTAHSGYLFKRNDILFGRTIKYGEVGYLQLLRLAKKDAGIWKRHIHEIWDVKGSVGNIQEPIIHYPHPTINEFLREINIYSTFVAQERYEQKTQVKSWEIIVFPVGKFMQNYIIRQGFRDGMPGLIIAIMMSFHSFLVRSKLYMLNRQTHTS